MVNFCANPGCGKPLHYLREGRIYVFDASVGMNRTGQKRERQLEHYWLCGDCARMLMLVQDAQGWIRIVERPDGSGAGDAAAAVQTEIAS